MIEGTFLAFAWRDSECHENLSQGNQMRFKPGTYKSRELLLPQLGTSVNDENSEAGRGVAVDKLKDLVCLWDL
jgi:hypothetical protein